MYACHICELIPKVLLENFFSSLFSLRCSLHRARLSGMWFRTGTLAYPSIPFKMRRKRTFWRSWDLVVPSNFVPMWILRYFWTPLDMNNKYNRTSKFYNYLHPIKWGSHGFWRKIVDICTQQPNRYKPPLDHVGKATSPPSLCLLPSPCPVTAPCCWLTGIALCPEWTWGNVHRMWPKKKSVLDKNPWLHL